MDISAVLLLLVITLFKSYTPLQHEQKNMIRSRENSHKPLLGYQLHVKNEKNLSDENYGNF